MSFFSVSQEPEVTILSGKSIQNNLQRGRLQKKLAEAFATFHLRAAHVQGGVVQAVCHKLLPSLSSDYQTAQQAACLS